MSKKVILIFITVLFVQQSFIKAQELEKFNFKEGYEVAELFLEDLQYSNALKIYLELNSTAPENANILYKIGFCILNDYSGSEKNRAISYLESAVKNISLNYVGDYKEVAAPIDAYFSLGKAYLIGYKLNKANETFETFKTYINTEDKKSHKLLEEVDRYIKMCSTVREVVNNPVSIKIENLGPNINTKYSEYAPVVSCRDDKQILIFTSRRKGTGNLIGRGGKYYEDIYSSEKNDGDANWKSATNIGKKINSKGHDAAVSLSFDGKQLFVYKDKKGDGNIYECDFEEGRWSKPRKLNNEINSKYWEAHASLSLDKTTLYFVSNRPGGFGGRDIYKATRMPDGEWGNVENLGATINTKYEEDSPFILADGITLYFASQGHKTMGGFDIFSSTIDEGFWSEPENIGYPINTTEDDIFYFPIADEKYAYYSSTKNNGLGEQDIYYITIIKEKKQLITISGIVADSADNKPIPIAKLIVRNADTKKNVKTININKSNEGKFSVKLAAGNTYELTASAKGYNSNYEKVSIDAKERKKEIKQDILLRELLLVEQVEQTEVGESFVLKNILYDYDRATLRPASIEELDKLYEIMIGLPNLKVEISSHTDSDGSDSYNKNLSERRAKSVVDYLINKGINKNRLIASGYGEEQPITTNDTDEGKQLNRRTEFKVLEK